MDNTKQPPHHLKAVGLSLQGKPAHLRNLAKIAAHNQLGKFSFSRRGFAIEILENSQEGNRLKIVVKASKSGKEFFVDNPLYYLNPPIIHNGVEDIAESLK